MEKQEVNDGIAQLIRKVRAGSETIFDLIGEDGDSVKRIEIAHRQLKAELPEQMPEADVARAKARSHVFNDLNTFIRDNLIEQKAELTRTVEKNTSVMQNFIEHQRNKQQ